MNSSIYLLDVTLRDGGLTNDFHFEDPFVKALFEANLRAGIGTMEIGYKASERMFKRGDFGKWKFCAEKDILDVLGEDAGQKIGLAVMADAGRCDYRTDILPRRESPLSMVRIACYMEQLHEALDMIEDCKKKGYEVSCNLMAVTALGKAQLRDALKLLAASPADVLYIVDSFGALLPTEAVHLTELFLEYAVPCGKAVGIHAHDNLSNALANTLLAQSAGAVYLDAAYGGMGRGAGSCDMTSLLGCLQYPPEALEAALAFTDRFVLPLRQRNAVWGPDPAYALTALLNRHPRDAIAYKRAGRQDIDRFLAELLATGESD